MKKKQPLSAFSSPFKIFYADERLMIYKTSQRNSLSKVVGKFQTCLVKSDTSTGSIRFTNLFK
jgi:hypothetical protein